MVSGYVRSLMRLEGIAMLIAGAAAFHFTSGQWWLFALLFFTPDLSFAGYLAGPKWGAAVYNMSHTTLGPLLAALLGWVLSFDLSFNLASIWLAHIGFDRTLGYGLKYQSGFRDTHLGRIGRDP